jgi:hypothetical protein
MFARSISALVGMLLVAGTLAVASAMATDEPGPPAHTPPGQTPPGQTSPGQAPPTQAPPGHGDPGAQGNSPRACVDHVRPRSRLGVRWKQSFRRGVLRGIAIDQGCGAAGAGKVKRVSVAITRKVGKRCQPLKRNGRLGHATVCRQVWLRAKGSKKWTFRLRHQLPRGTYIVSTRAVDSAGNVESRAHS